MQWLHGIRPDKRPATEKSIEDRAYGGERISLTFRHIGTFLNPAGDTIWGQGAVSKRQDQVRPVIHGDAGKTEQLIRAFGQENHATEFDWDKVYGDGFDVVNFVTASSTAQLVLGDDPVANLRAGLGLSESSLRYDTVPKESESSAKQPVYISVDGNKIAGDIEILKHLGLAEERPGIDQLHGGALLPRIEELLVAWRMKPNNLDGLQIWEQTLKGQHYLGGSVFGIDDCSLWPVLRDIVQSKNSDFSTVQFPNLHQYYHRVSKRGLVKAVLEDI